MSLIRNERIKLLANYVNGLAIATFAVGGLAPLFSFLYGTSPITSPSFVAIVTGICLLASSTLHWAGSLTLKRLQT